MMSTINALLARGELPSPPVSRYLDPEQLKKLERALHFSNDQQPQNSVIPSTIAPPGRITGSNSQPAIMIPPPISTTSTTLYDSPKSSPTSTSSDGSLISETGSSGVPTTLQPPISQVLNGHDDLGLSGLWRSKFPGNPSLAADMERLFVAENGIQHHQKSNDGYEAITDITNEFQANGRDASASQDLNFEDLEKMMRSLELGAAPPISRDDRLLQIGGSSQPPATLGQANYHLSRAGRPPMPPFYPPPPVADADLLSKERLHDLIRAHEAAKSRAACRRVASKVCVFCRNNGEAEVIYMSHQLKDITGRVTCPILRAYTCPNCNANGDDAHTLKYCPLTSQDSNCMRALKAGRACTGRLQQRKF